MNRIWKSSLSFALSAATLMGGQVKSLEEMAHDSALIVVGQVTIADSYVAADGEVYTNVTVRSEATLKDLENAGAQGEVHFRVKGGVIGDLVVQFSDAPAFSAGENVVLFGGTGETAPDKLPLEASNGTALLERLARISEDAGETLPPQMDRAWKFLRSLEHRGPQERERTGEIELNAAVACAAYSGPKWTTPSTTFSLGPGLPTAWAQPLLLATQSWNNAGSRFSFSQNSTSPHAVLLSDLGAGGPLASTRSEYYQTSKQMVKFTLTYNNRYTWTTTGEAGKFDVQAIATHEFGHALGLNHPTGSTCQEQTMWASAGAGEVKKRTLESGDREGVVTLYGAAGSTTSSTPTPAPAAPTPAAAPAISSFAVVAIKAVATKPTVLLFQGAGLNPATLQGFITGGFCGAAGCVATPFAAAGVNAVFINTLPAGTYSVGVRNGATGAVSTRFPVTVSAN